MRARVICFSAAALAAALVPSIAGASPRLAGPFPAAFEENRGQFDKEARFVVRGPQGASCFTTDGVALDFRLSTSASEVGDDPMRRISKSASRNGGRRCAVRMSFADASGDLRLERGHTLPGEVNYLIGHRTQWVTGVRRYAGVTYRNVWPGIDVAYSGQDSGLKYDVVVHPGADPSCIVFRYDGVDELSLGSDGALMVRVQGKTVREHIPEIYQETTEGRVTVEGGYRLLGRNGVGFRLAGYDRSQPLIIDPASDLIWGTFLGGSEIDEIRDIARDNAGNIYATGYTESPNFPVSPGAYDASYNLDKDVFVAKLNSTGTQLIYATFVGGSSVEAAYCLAVNPVTGVAYFGGNTYSPDFPVPPTAFDAVLDGEDTYDGFVAGLNAAGNALVCCTFLGGAEDDVVIGLTLDGSGSPIAVGSTESSDFPVVTGSYDTAYSDNADAFVTRLDPTGTVAHYSTFLGHSYKDEAYDVAVDATGNAWVCGIAGSDGFPATASAYDGTYNGGGDAFVARLNAAGTSLLYSTFLGGDDIDDARSIALGADGSIYIGGRTESTDFPTTPGAFQTSRAGDPGYDNPDAFLARLHSTGLFLEYATYIGGGNSDYITSVAVDSSGHAYAAGVTTSYSFPVTQGAFSTVNSSLSTWQEGFLLKVNAAGSGLIYSTYVGSQGIDYAYTVIPDASGGVFAAGATRSSDFPVTYGAYDTAIGFVDGWVWRLAMPDWVPPEGAVAINGDAVYCTGISVTLDVEAADNDSDSAIQMRFSNNDVTYTAWQALAGTRSWNLTSGDGSKTVYAQFKDDSGNVSDAVTDTIVLDTVPPTGSIIVNGGASSTTNPACTLTLSATDAGMGVAAMRFSNDGGNWSAWLAYAETADWTLVGGDGNKAVYVQFRDGAGRTSVSFSDTILLDQTPPFGSVVIDDYATYTLGTTVTLTPWANDPVAGAALMRFSNDEQTWSTWQTYSTSGQDWTLLSGDGEKTVYAQYKDWAGNTSSNFTDTIILDQNAPTGSITIASGAECVPGADVQLGLPAEDAGTGVQTMRIRNAGAAWPAWEAYSATQSWSLAAGDGLKTVEVQFKDGAGKQSAIYSDAVTVDSIAPQGTVLINGKDAYCNALEVALTLEATDDGCGVSEMRFLTAAGRWTPWQAFNNKHGWTLASGDGEKTVTAQFRDTAGNQSKDAVDTIVLDTGSPTGSIQIDGGAAYANSQTVMLTLNAQDTLSGVSEMRLRNSPAVWGAWQAYTASTLWLLAPGDGSKTVSAQYRDRAGNTSLEYSDSIVLDATAPTGSVVINGGAAYTTNASVILTIAASDALSGLDGMQLSNDGTSWTSWQVFAASRAWTLASGNGMRAAYLRFRDVAGNVSDAATDLIAVGQPISLPQARMLPNGELVILAAAPVSASFPGETYLMDPGRACGLRVLGALGAARGDAVDLAGETSTAGGEKSITPVTWSVTSVVEVRPLGIRNSQAGGGDWLYDPATGTGQRGTAGGSGLNTVGQYVRAWGACTVVNASSIILDDGSGQPLRCMLPSGISAGASWRLVEVTGVVSCVEESGQLLPLIRVASPADVRVLVSDP